ncbi:MAG: GNAT family N-acetyltransferase [Acidimicrobiia bacterium]|nr:GNAT family N-acetyltransferase [Acidimicrobiia bacterium]NNC75209.1 GNAT family N-acetyltransferase [Acidimicrobiia bacterium]
MRIHDDLATPALDLEPAAPFVGPFAGRQFLSAWWGCVPSGGELQVVETSDAALVVTRGPDAVRFAGASHLTDYHAPLGAGAVDLIRQYALAEDPGTRFEFDSLPREAADVVTKGLEAAGLVVTEAEHEVAAVLPLPGDPDEYLAGLGKKQRHEVRRKRRRFVEVLGTARFAGGTADDFDSFVGMHRAADGEKGEFMTDAYAEFFRSLLDDAGARLDVLRGDGDVPVAAAIGFEDEDCYYLYNSAYDPGMADASPGIVLVTGLIDRAIDAGKTRFDFLKGDEVYKFRLGAVARPLYLVEAAT